MSKTLHVALGFEVVPAKNWRAIMPPPRKPANWKEETFQAKLPELMAAQETDAPHYPLTGRVSKLWACIVGDKVEAAEVGATPTGLVAWCMKAGGITEVTSESVVFYGVGLRRQLRKLAMQSPRDTNAARLLIDGRDSPTKVDLFSYCGVRDLFESAQALARTALALDYRVGAQGEAEAVAAVAGCYGLDLFAGKPGFAALEW